MAGPKDYELVLSHRFRVSTGQEEDDKALLMVTEVELEDNTLFLEYYACAEMFKFITTQSGLNHLLIALLDENGKPIVDVVLNDLTLVESGVGNLKLSVTETDQVMLTAVYQFDTMLTAVTE